MSYKGLGSRGPILGSADTTGNNTGNWTVTFDPSVISSNVPEFEVYKIVVRGGNPTATFDVYIDAKQWDTALYPAANAWDPNEPMLLNPGQTVYFYFRDPATSGFTPQVIMWLRYDATLYGLKY